ncbi:MAG: thioredoxin family protein [Methanobrevibacter sp.]|uniref:thioredoxin family protein n=1 Tax=Methanobrevibacter sp. TaxID=66852 RepID=UPI0026E01C43|nr:thioredoxin family protein [Methanobrevibacter sp.]MDO5848381.1 thioredoxin family protein [Methanobrevibacter sp.]
MKKGIKVALIIIVIAIVGTALLLVMGSENLEMESTNINSTNNITEAEEIADAQNKDVFVLFTSDTCTWCDKLKSDTLSDEKVIEKINKYYVTAVVDIDKQPDVANAYHAVATPVIVLLDSNGTEKARLNGYYGPAELLEYI